MTAEPVIELIDPNIPNFTKCPKCYAWMHFSQDFCMRCLDDESKWRLGVL